MLKASYFDKILSFHQVSFFSTEKGLFFSYILVPLRKASKISGFVVFLRLFLCTSKMGLSSQETLNVTLNNSSHSHERLKSLDRSLSRLLRLPTQDSAASSWRIPGDPVAAVLCSILKKQKAKLGVTEE